MYIFDTKLITLFIIILFNGSVVFSQIRTGSAIYNVTAIEKNYDNEDERVNEFFKNVHHAVGGLRFELTFHDHMAQFNPLKNMNTDDGKFILDMISSIVSSGVYYTNNKTDEVIRTVDEIYGKNLFLKVNAPKEGWKLHKETKKIGKYLCYKATRNKVITNARGAFNFTIEAWYAPDVPANFGPNEYHGLPGLIMGLKDTHFIFTLEELTLNPKKKVKIKVPKKQKIISEKEYSEMTKAGVQNFQDLIKN